MKKTISKRVICVILCTAFAAIWVFGGFFRTYAAVECGTCTTGPGVSDTGHASGTTENGLIYEITDGYAVIKGYDCSADIVEIPERIMGCPVTEIGYAAFQSCKTLKNVFFPDSLTAIGDYAFCGCESLEFPKLPSGVYKIGEFAFSSCSSFTYVITPQALMELGKGAFSDCFGVGKMTVSESSVKYRAQGNCIIEKRSQILVSGCKNSEIPDGNISKIADYAFYNCAGFTSAYIPDSVTAIGEYAFAGCKDMRLLRISANASEIGDYAFAYCAGLFSVTVPDCVQKISSHMFYGCKGLFELILHDKLDKIGDSAFYGCALLKDLDIPKSVTYIGKSAFNGCGIVDLYIPANVFTIEGNPFADCFDLASITVEEGNVVFCSAGDCLIEKRAAKLVAGCKNSVIPKSGVSFIGDSAFRGNSVPVIVIPDNVTQIGFSAFEGCKLLASVDLPKDLTKIDGFAFSGCVSLKGLSFTDKIAEIGVNAFNECVSVTDAVLPGSVVTIGAKAFYGCTALERVVIGSGAETIGDKAFSYCPSIVDISVAKGNATYHSENNCVIVTAKNTLIIGVKTSVIPDDGSVTVIEQSAFFGNTGLTQINIPDAVKTVRFDAFAFCAGLRSLHIGKGVMELGVNAFRNCPSLESITVEEGNVVFYSIDNCVIETRGKGLVLGCKASKIPLDDRVRTICFGAFSGSDRMTYTVIPVSVSEIANQAFKDCLSLKVVFYEGTKEQWEKINIGSENECLTGARIFFGRRERITAGDVTGDNSADSADASFVLKADAGMTVLTEEQIYAADVNRDGEADSSDAALILKYDAGTAEIE